MAMSITMIALGMYLMHKQIAMANQHSQIAKEMDGLTPNLPPVEIIGDRINYGRADDINGRRTAVVARPDMHLIHEDLRKPLLENEALNRRYHNILYDKQISGEYFNGQMKFFNPMWNDTMKLPLRNVTDLMTTNMSEIDMTNKMNSIFYNGVVMKT